MSMTSEDLQQWSELTKSGEQPSDNNAPRMHRRFFDHDAGQMFDLDPDIIGHTADAIMPVTINAYKDRKKNAGKQTKSRYF